MLIDRSTARITTGQRVSLNSVEEASRQDRDGVPYFVFEHVSQVRPCCSRVEACSMCAHVSQVQPSCSCVEACSLPGSCAGATGAACLYPVLDTWCQARCGCCAALLPLLAAVMLHRLCVLLHYPSGLPNAAVDATRDVPTRPGGDRSAAATPGRFWFGPAMLWAACMLCRLRGAALLLLCHALLNRDAAAYSISLSVTCC